MMMTPLLIAVLIELVLIVAALFFAWYLNRNRDREKLWKGARYAAWAGSALLLLFISSTRPVRLDERRMGYVQPKPAPAGTTQLILIELEKANDEIELRIQQEDTWFHYKFVLVGAMLAALFALMRHGRDKEPFHLSKEITSAAACSVVALACVVAIAIDTHLRNNITVIQQLAIWIQYYVEPALAPPVPGFKAWETFLRTPGAGMHGGDDWYSLAFYPHLHFLTWVLYVVYVGLFQTRAMRPADDESTRGMLVLGFLLVHAAFTMFAFVGHFVPRAFELNAIPFVECWHSGERAARIYWIAGLLLATLNAPFVIRILRQR